MRNPSSQLLIYLESFRELFRIQAGPASKSRIFYPTRFAGRFRTPKNAVYMAEKRIFFCVA